MARYTKLEKKDFDEINEYYDLSIENFTSINGGAANSSFLCKLQNEEIVITVFGDKSLEYVKTVGKLLQYLEIKNFPTTQIISPIDGKNPIMTLLGKPVMVKRFIPGEINQALDKDMLFQIGSMLANLHKIQAPDFLRVEHPYGRQLYSSVIGKSIDVNYENWLAERLEILNQSIPNNIPTCLIHGDLFFDNILFKDSKLIAFIDFVEACHYYRAFDIGMGIVGMCVEGGKVNLEKAEYFVHGYQDVQSLEEIEKLNLKIFIEYAAITTSYWRFWRYNVYEKIPEKSELHMQMVEIADTFPHFLPVME